MAKATIVERDAQNPSRLNVLWATYLVSGLRIIGKRSAGPTLR